MLVRGMYELIKTIRPSMRKTGFCFGIASALCFVVADEVAAGTGPLLFLSAIKFTAASQAE